MKSLLLDTNIIVDALRKRNDRHLLVDHFLDEGLPLASCPITITEIYAGMRPHEEKPTRAFMRSLLFFAITEEVAEQAGLLKAQYARRGRTRIAAVCIAYGCTLVTENAKDFPMPELQLYPLPQNPT